MWTVSSDSDRGPDLVVHRQIPAHRRFADYKTTLTSSLEQVRSSFLVTAILLVSNLLAVVGCAEPASDLIRVSEIKSEDVRFVTYADRATIKKSGDTVQMSSVIDPEVPDDRRRVSWKDEWDYQCLEKLARPNRYNEFSGKMGTGKKIYSQSTGAYGQYWTPVVPGSVTDKLWRIACGKE